MRLDILAGYDFASAGYAESRQLPRIVALHFGYGHVELVANTRGEGADDAALALEALVLRKAQGDLANSDVQGVMSPYSRYAPYRITCPGFG